MRTVKTFNNSQSCFLIICLVMFSSVVLHAQVNQSGNIENTITDIVSTIPGMGTTSFVIPTTAQMSSFESVFAAIKSGNISSVQNLATPFGYTFIRFVHTPTSDTFYLLKENTPVQRGWGTYLFNTRTINDLAIEVPHPLWDRYTWSMGIKAFIGANAKCFFLAGTHRYANSDSSSDMAHVTKSIFYTAHKYFANATAIQVHGFDGSSPIYSGYPDAVISNGTLYPSTIYYTLRDKYNAEGFTAGVFSYATYNQLKQLGATTNTEGIWSNNNNKKFVHIEHDQPLRFDTTNLKKSANAIIKTFGTTVGIQPEHSEQKQFTILSAYPNPFNPTTSISVSLSKPGEFILSIKDIFGRTVEQLHEGYIVQGTHLFKFNAVNLSSGVYFCSLSGNRFTKTTKLLLLK